jgi:hypothetical protein
MMNETSLSELEVGHVSLNHVGEELCGDAVMSHLGEDGALTYVLADGLGSGVTANILSTLTSTMLVKMMAGGLSLEESVGALVQTLPVSLKRGNVAYSTFTIVQVQKDFTFVLYNFDNPEPVFLHQGQAVDLHYQSVQIGDKTILRTSGTLELHDVLLLFSDGAVYAGVGETLNFGWTRPEIVAYMEALYHPEITATNLASSLVEHCDVLYNHREGDDTTACAIRRRERHNLNLLVGPASKKEDDAKMMSLFFHKGGEHVICGGTTATVAAKYLHESVDTSLEYVDPHIPPTSKLQGVDLVTEGVITLNKVVELAKDYLDKDREYFNWCFRQDGASLLAKALFQDATDISFYVGCAVNPAHQEKDLGIDITLKMQLVEELTKYLKAMDKHIHVCYF